ncbi:hypothetical protein F5141DRAFT_1066996 [Pisolithus sp. B1]|nr:hypothetical protein F5141DRAFT_1066996 [Pisolithus sp. B1]
MANTRCNMLSDKVGIIHGQKNVPWQTLLDLLYLHQFTLVDWPAGVSAVGANFNVKCLNADELHALIIPFLKEQMGADYMLEAPGDDDEDVVDEGLVPVPKSSFYLADWTPGISVSVQHNILELTNQPEQLELFRDVDLKTFDVPLVINTYDQLLHLLSDSQAFLKGLPKGMNQPPIDGASTSVALPLPSSLPLPPSPSLPPSSPPPLSSSPTRPSPSPPRSRTWIISQPLPGVTGPAHIVLCLASMTDPPVTQQLQIPREPREHQAESEEEAPLLQGRTHHRMVTMHGISLAGIKCLISLAFVPSAPEVYPMTILSTKMIILVLSYIEVSHRLHPIVTSLYPAVHNKYHTSLDCAFIHPVSANTLRSYS